MKNDKLYEAIFRRKSIRKYNMSALSDMTLADIQGFANTVKPLDETIQYEFSHLATDEVKNMLPIKAPHYICLYSEKKGNYLMNAGFLLQQINLYLSDNNLGSCWLGMAKPTQNQQTELPFVISMAFGYPSEELYRNVSDFKRKSLTEISEGADSRLEAARLAPSGMNSIDTGIALCHLYVASKSFSFVKLNSFPERKGYIYMGTVK